MRYLVGHQLGRQPINAFENQIETTILRGAEIHVFFLTPMHFENWFLFCFLISSYVCLLFLICHNLYLFVFFLYMCCFFPSCLRCFESVFMRMSCSFLYFSIFAIYVSYLSFFPVFSTFTGPAHIITDQIVTSTS